MITPEMYNELRIQEQQGQEMADEKNKSIQLRKDIMKLALAESATDCTIMCGTPHFSSGLATTAAATTSG